MQQYALALLVSGLRSIYAAEPPRVYLCGSRARGDARPDSDLDIALVFPHPVQHHAEMARTSHLRLAVLEATGLIVDFAFLTPAQWERAGSREAHVTSAEEIHRSLRSVAQEIPVS